MVLRMPTLTRAKNGDWFARKVIPSDVRDAYQRAYGIRQEERFRAHSGQTSNAAKLAYTEWLANVEGRIAALRSTRAGEGIELTTRQAHEIAGRWYDWFLHQHADGELPVEHWDHQHERYQDAVSRFDGTIGSPDEPVEDAPRGTAASRHIRATVVELAMLATFLADEGVSLSTGSYGRLVDVVERDLSPAMATLRRRAGGDYRPDTHRERFPQATEIVPANAKLSGWNAWDAFEAWAKERKPAAATVNRWRGVFLNLKEFMDGRDIAFLTDEDAVRWKDTLVAGGASARTINDVPLTAARRIFGWAVSQKRITSNPFSGLKVATGRAKPTRGEFTEADVETILRATLAHQSTFMSPYLKAAIRWVPWLCAYTGARSGEMTQLRRKDIERHPDDFWMLHIRMDAGTVKGGVERTVPLHDHLVEQGFIEFVQAAKDGPLFYDAKIAAAQKTVDPLKPPRPPYVQTRQKLGDWVRKLGVSDEGVGPNHGWRHTFKRRAARAEMEQRLRDAFCGHSAGHVGSIYELPSVEDLAKAIKRFPAYPVGTQANP